VSTDIAPKRDVALQGEAAGIITRLVGFMIDVLWIVTLYSFIVRIVEVLVSTISGEDFTLMGVTVAPWALLIVVATLSCVYPVAARGRTLGMAVTGLRVVRPDGTVVGSREAVVRLLALPLSFLTLGIGFVFILLRPDGRALHDLIGRTSVVYAWDARAARLRFLAREDGTNVVE
jgi:uncharacterized RDD family membrane protein YckC